ncbi:GIY-YIG nuclease family protein, partial [Sphingobacterium wenxiniae]
FIDALLVYRLLIMYFVYVLYSSALDRYYVGYTSDLFDRLKKHNNHHRGFTGRTSDWRIVYTEIYEEKLQAMDREQEIKSWKSRKRLINLISSAGSGHSD